MMDASSLWIDLNLEMAAVISWMLVKFKVVLVIALHDENPCILSKVD